LPLRERQRRKGAVGACCFRSDTLIK
jgi:hypothetical protein